MGAIGIDMSSGTADEAADRALSSVSRKLDKALSVEYTVNELVAEATDIANLATIYYGISFFLLFVNIVADFNARLGSPVLIISICTLQFKSSVSPPKRLLLVLYSKHHTLKYHNVSIIISLEQCIKRSNRVLMEKAQRVIDRGRDMWENKPKGAPLGGFFYNVCMCPAEERRVCESSLRSKIIAQ